MEQDEDVISWETEPFRVPYLFEGREHNYVPDILVKMKNGTIAVIEVKPESLVDDPKNKAKIEAGRAFCSELEYGYVIMSEQDLGMST